ncbi:uncharacterized protein LOC111707193 [Eurytemora carolleeae]|uniref:uncharacterized protein LOC111707193 n=1 Tax=Eurytemora carolleeae TaxID=1294199 RepID=UPI000C7563E5|nr:uncharacterized protein LOC111707193 [Eurytemora carolleeae]|eukprot:XP_023336016.1 uncharacterized protein LOC111707193 [Eurytemora affinis]
MSGHIALGLCFLVTALLCIQADTDVLCKSGTKDYTVDLPSNTTYKFGTAYRRYKARQRCTATYTLTTCEQASISCSSFSTIGFRGCTRGDYLLIKDSMGNKRFCNTNKPIEYKPTGDFSIQFVSDAKRASTGLKCTVTCDSPSGELKPSFSSK